MHCWHSFKKSPLETLKFVKGTGLHLSDLRKVNINEANSAIVLAETLDDTLASAVDAKSILIIMNIKKLNPSIHVVVELLKSDSVENAKIAGADENWSAEISSQNYWHGVSSIPAQLISWRLS